MIKYEMDKGELKDLEIKGNILEIVADVSMLYYLIGAKMMNEGIQYYAAFKATLMESMDGADDCIKALAKDVAKEKIKKNGETGRKVAVKDLLKALFGNDFENFMKEMKAREYADAEGFTDEKGDKK